jgi:polysaccharide deacetylase family protein (PEP-CTERM system associated)
MLPNVLSVDVEEYFHVEALSGLVARKDWSSLPSRVEQSTQRVLDLFAARGAKATFFTLGWVARRHPKLIRRIVSEGHELASHGENHRMITAMTTREFRQDIRDAKAILEDVSGAEVIGYRAPTFSVVRETLWALDELREAGYRYDSSIYPIVHDRYGIADAPRRPHRIEQGPGKAMIELPMTTARILGRNVPAGGGGYLRLLPMAYNQWVLEKAETEGPFVVYFHPWEIDPEQPRFELHGIARARAYAGLGGMEQRLRALLDRYPFGPARKVLEVLGLLAPSRISQIPSRDSRERITLDSLV